MRKGNREGGGGGGRESREGKGGRIDCLQSPLSLKIRQGLINPSSVSYNRGIKERGLERDVCLLVLRYRLVPILLSQIFADCYHCANFAI